jgi:hypothetical protein
MTKNPTSKKKTTQFLGGVYVAEIHHPSDVRFLLQNQTVHPFPREAA